MMSAHHTPISMRVRVVPLRSIPKSDRDRMIAARERLARNVCDIITKRLAKETVEK
jgi:hypothetical protein